MSKGNWFARCAAKERRKAVVFDMDETLLTTDQSRVPEDGGPDVVEADIPSMGKIRICLRNGIKRLLGNLADRYDIFYMSAGSKDYVEAVLEATDLMKYFEKGWASEDLGANMEALLDDEPLPPPKDLRLLARPLEDIVAVDDCGFVFSYWFPANCIDVPPMTCTPDDDICNWLEKKIQERFEALESGIEKPDVSAVDSLMARMSELIDKATSIWEAVQKGWIDPLVGKAEMEAANMEMAKLRAEVKSMVALHGVSCMPAEAQELYKDEVPLVLHAGRSRRCRAAAVEPYTLDAGGTVPPDKLSLYNDLLVQSAEALRAGYEVRKRDRWADGDLQEWLLGEASNLGMNAWIMAVNAAPEPDKPIERGMRPVELGDGTYLETDLRADVDPEIPMSDLMKVFSALKDVPTGAPVA